MRTGEWKNFQVLKLRNQASSRFFPFIVHNVDGEDGVEDLSKFYKYSIPVHCMHTPKSQHCNMSKNTLTSSKLIKNIYPMKAILTILQYLLLITFLILDV